MTDATVFSSRAVFTAGAKDEMSGPLNTAADAAKNLGQELGKTEQVVRLSERSMANLKRSIDPLFRATDEAAKATARMRDQQAQFRQVAEREKWTQEELAHWIERTVVARDKAVSRANEAAAATVKAEQSVLTATQVATQAFEERRRALDPLYAAQVKVAQADTQMAIAITEVNAALGRGQITLAEQINLLSRVANEHRNVTAAATASAQAQLAAEQKRAHDATPAAQYSALRTRIDPAYAAESKIQASARQLAADQKILEAALKSGDATVEDYNRDLALMTARHELAAQAARDHAAAQMGVEQQTTGVARNMRTLGQQLGATGLQVQDFAVQMAGGQSVMQAATQQLPQLVSNFGYWGAAAGAVVAILGAVAIAIATSSDRMKQLTEANEKAEAPYKELLDRSTAYTEALDKQGDKYTEVAAAGQRYRDGLRGESEALATMTRYFGGLSTARRSYEEANTAAAAATVRMAQFRAREVVGAAVNQRLDVNLDAGRVQAPTEFLRLRQQFQQEGNYSPERVLRFREAILEAAKGNETYAASFRRIAEDLGKTIPELDRTFDLIQRHENREAAQAGNAEARRAVLREDVGATPGSEARQRAARAARIREYMSAGTEQDQGDAAQAIEAINAAAHAARPAMDQLLDKMRQQAELAGIAAGAARELATAEQQVQETAEASGKAWDLEGNAVELSTEKAEARRLTQERLNAEFRASMAALEQQIQAQQALGEAQLQGRDAVMAAEARSKAMTEALKTEAAGTDAYTAKVNELTSAFLRLAQAGAIAQANARIDQQAAQVELAEQEVRLRRAGRSDRDIAVARAQRLEYQRLGEGLSETPEGSSAIATAGTLAGRQYDADRANERIRNKRGAGGGDTDPLERLKRLAETSRVAAGAERELIDAEESLTGKWDTAANRAEARRLAQVRLDNQLRVSMEETQKLIDAEGRMAAAYLQGSQAARRQEIAERARVDALKYAKAGTAEYTAAVEKLTRVNTEYARSQQGTRNAQAIQQQRDQMELIAAETRLIGESADVRERELAAIRERQRIRGEGLEGAEHQEERVSNAQRIAEDTARLQRMTQAMQEVQRIGEQAFDRIGESITQAFVNGSAKAIDFKSIVKGVMSEIAQAILKLAVINPVMNELLGGEHRSTIFDVQRAMSRQGGSSSSGGGLDLGSLSKLFGGSESGGAGSLSTLFGGSSIGAATPTATSSFGSGLGGLPALSAESSAAAAGGSSVAGGAGTAAAGGSGAAAAGGSVMAGFASVAGGVVGGYAMGTMLGSLVSEGRKSREGNSSAGAAAGAVAGAIIGSVIPVVGTILGGIIGGALGGLLGGMIGPANSDRTQLARMNASSGAIEYSGLEGKRFSQVNRDAATQTATQIRTTLLRLAEATGSRLETGEFTVGYGDRDGAFSKIRGVERRYARDEAGLTRLVVEAISAMTDELVGGYSDEIKAAVRKVGPQSMEDLESITAWISGTYKQLVEVEKPGTEYEEAIKRINRTYDDAIKQARDLGIGEDKLNEGRAKSIALVDEQVRAQDEAARKEKERQAEEELQGRAGTAAGLITGLADYAKSLRYSEASPLSPRAMFTAANDNFSSVLSRAMGGDFRAMSSLQGAAADLLATGREVEGSGAGYASLFDRVTAGLESISGVSAEALTASVFTEESKKNTDVLVEELQRLRTEVSALRQEVRLNGLTPARAA